LEAQNRIGGRIHTVQTLHSVRDASATPSHMCTVSLPVDLGAMFVGKSQQRLVKLVDKFGLSLCEVFDCGKRIIDYGNKHGAADGSAPASAACEDGFDVNVLRKDAHIAQFSGLIPKGVSVFTLLDLQKNVLWELDRLASRVPLDDPWRLQEASKWDSISLQRFVDDRIWTDVAKRVIAMVVSVVFGCEPCDISFLYFLYYVRAAGGLVALTEVKGGAQEYRIAGGAGQLCSRLASAIGPVLSRSSHCAKSNGAPKDAPRSKIHMDEPVVSIEHLTADGAPESAPARDPDTFLRVITTAETYYAHFAIVAMPPSACVRVQFKPALPYVRYQLNQRVFMGCYTKCAVFYETPFWREAGLSGEAINCAPCAAFPVLAVYDYVSDGVVISSSSTAAGALPRDQQRSSVSALMCFLTGDTGIQFGQLSRDEQRAALVRSLVRFFGQKAANPLSFCLYAWSENEWTRGCPVDIFPAGSFAPFARVLREPCGLIHWAGTEAATEWPGYMEGAIQSGERASLEVLNALSSPERAISPPPGPAHASDGFDTLDEKAWQQSPCDGGGTSVADIARARTLRERVALTYGWVDLQIRREQSKGTPWRMDLFLVLFIAVFLAAVQSYYPFSFLARQ